MRPRAIAYYARSVLTLLTGMREPFRIVAIFLGLAGAGTRPVRLRSRKLAFHVRNRMEIWAIKESTLDLCYETYGFPLEMGWTVVDVGAALGDFAIDAAQKVGGGRVLAFEPLKVSYDLLMKNVALNGVANVVAANVAVAGRTGLATMSGQPDMPLQVRFASAEDAQGGSVETICLDSVIAFAGHVDLLKLDCEGAEFDILPSADLAHRVDRIVIEYHDGDGRAHGSLVSLLQENGYRVDVFPNAVHPETLGYLRAILRDLEGAAASNQPR